MAKSNSAIRAWYRAQRAAGNKWLGECLMAARTALGATAVYPNAAAGWSGVKHKGSGSVEDAPSGVYVWWTGGSDKLGHVAFKTGNASDGSTQVWCNVDWGTNPGRIQCVKLSALEAACPDLKRAGWSYDCDNVLPSDSPYLRLEH